MTSVGELLKQERIRQQRSVEEIATSLRIMRRYLEAIESDNAQALPGGPFYYKSFVKQYAAALGLDGEKLQPQVEQAASVLEPPAVPGLEATPVRDRDLDPIVSETNRQILSERRFGGAWIALLVALVGCSTAYAWLTRNAWQFPWEKPAVSVQSTPAQTPVAAKPESTPVENPVTQQPAEPANVETQPVSNPVTPDPGTQPPSDSAALMPQDGTGMAQVTLDVSATEMTWLSIVSDGKRVFTGVLQPSESKTLAGREVARLKVGNAGGLEVRWNGKAIGPLGPRGQVRVVNFTKDNYEIVQPKKEEYE